MTATAVCELFLREQFHRIASEFSHLFEMGMVFVAATSVTMVAGSTSKFKHYVPILGRLGLLAATTASLSMIAAGRITPFPSSLSLTSLLLCSTALLCVLWMVARSLRIYYWKRTRLALSIGCFLYVISQPFLIAAKAPDIRWPAWPRTLIDTKSAAKTAQFFVLLDELNASASQEIIQVFEQNGFKVQMKIIEAIGDSTAKVIPAMFSGGNFEEASPCGMVTTCGSHDVMDFSKVIATRADIDVVGFFMPYCAMRGLRYCDRLSVSSPFLDWRRWWCASLRRIHYSPQITHETCAREHTGTWDQLTADVESAIWQAPIWREGGFMYAHVPLPHPPGRLPEATLAADYAQNVKRAAGLIERMVLRARDEKIDRLTFVIFSDHPLRVKYWCQTPTYSGTSCGVNKALIDQHVPLIVAGDALPPIDSININTQIFSIQPAH